MQIVTKKLEKENLASNSAVAQALDIASASILDTLAVLHANPVTDLTSADQTLS
jgi:hypothetical protein